MPKRFALLLGIVGYLLAVWCYSGNSFPLTSDFGRSLLWNMCFSCMNVTGLHSGRVRLAFLVVGPINAVIYASIGFLVGKLLVALSTRGEKADGKARAMISHSGG